MSYQKPPYQPLAKKGWASISAEARPILYKAQDRLQRGKAHNGTNCFVVVDRTPKPYSQRIYAPATIVGKMCRGGRYRLLVGDYPYTPMVAPYYECFIVEQ